MREGCRPTNMLWYLDLNQVEKSTFGGYKFGPYDFFKGQKKLPIVKLVDDLEAEYSYVANEGSVFTFQTNLEAPRYRWGRLAAVSLEPHRIRVLHLPQQSKLW